MAAVSLDVLVRDVSNVREHPRTPYEKSAGMTLDDLRQSMVGVRKALIESIVDAPDRAFELQPETTDGEEVWSVGEILGHCNGALIGIGRSALEMIGVDAGEPPAELTANSEPRQMTRSEAVEAANVSIDDFYSLIPEGADIEKSADLDFFGKMSCRSWLYFMAMHEAEHVVQIRDLG